MTIAENSAGRNQQSSRTEVANGRRNLGSVRLQREMPGVEEADKGVRDVVLERLGPLRHEDWIVLSPHRQEGRLVGSKVLLECRIERDVAFVVPEQVELKVSRAGTTQVEVVERVTTASPPGIPYWLRAPGPSGRRVVCAIP